MHRQYYRENKQKGLGQAKAEQNGHANTPTYKLNSGGDEYFKVLSTVGRVTDTVSR